VRKWPAAFSTHTERTLQFAAGEFNFVKTRAQHGTKEAVNGSRWPRFGRSPGARPLDGVQWGDTDERGGM
jgi:hypothetical protein